MLVQGDIVIARPVLDVFDFVADERNEPRYNTQMVRAEKITDGPIGVGTRFHSVMTGAGRVGMTIEFTEFDRPRRIAETTHMTNMDIEGALTFEPVAEGTRLRWTWQLRPRGFLKLLGPFIRRTGERQESRVWLALKTVMESERASDMRGR